MNVHPPVPMTDMRDGPGSLASARICASVLALLFTAASAASWSPAVARPARPAPIVLVADDRHVDPELEALLPATLGGTALTIESQAGIDLSTQSSAFDTFLASLGKSKSEFSLASAYARQGSLKAEIGAWRVRGAERAALLPGFQTAVQASSNTPLTIVTENLAGREVTRIGDPGQLARGPLYVVVRGDTLLFVQTTVPALAAEAIEKLPR